MENQTIKQIWRKALPFISLASMFFLWEISSKFGWINSVIFPPPSRVINYFVESGFSVGIGFERVTIFETVSASLLRVLVGLLIGFILSFILGVLLSISDTFSGAMEPLIKLLAPIAPIAWIPLAISIFGVGNSAAVFLVFMGVIFVLTVATQAAIKNVSKEYIYVARTLGADELQIWSKIIIPAVLPQLFLLLRINFFAAWMAVLAAEMVGLKSGLGALIMVGRESSNYNLIIIGMALIGLTGYAVDSLLLFTQKKLFWWGNTAK